MASRRGRPRKVVPDEKGDNDKTVQRGIGLSLRNLEKQTRTKIIDQNVKSKTKQKARNKANAERRRIETELRAMEKFRNSAVEVPDFDEDAFSINDFPSSLSLQTEYVYVVPPSPSRQPLMEYQNHPQDAPPISAPSVFTSDFIQEPNGDVRENTASMHDLEQNYRPDRVRIDSNRNENEDRRSENLQQDDYANGAYENGSSANEDDEEERVAVMNEFDYVDPGREELEYHPEREGDEWPEDNWKSAGIEEDDMLPDLIVPGEGCDMYDDVRLRERFFRFAKEYDDDDDEFTNSPPVRVNGYIANVPEDYDSGKCLEPSPRGDHLLLWPVTEVQAQEELYQIIKASDIQGYFDYIARTFVRPRNRSGACSSSCGCNGPWLHSRNRFNPLHIAAIISTAQFVECMIAEHIAYEELVVRKGESDFTTEIHDHYMKTLRDWSSQSNLKCSMDPMDLAADFGRTDILHVLMNSDVGQWTLSARDKGHDMKFPPKSYETYHHKSAAGMLTSLFENDKWNELSDNDKCTVWREASHNQKHNAAIVAASTGNAVLLDFLKSDRKDVLTDNLPERDCFAGRVNGEGMICYPPPPAHLLAQYGHFEMFEKMSDEEKRCRDVFNFTALNCMFEFTDEQITSQLKLFRNVKREDAFVFVSQIIVKQRFGLLNLVLNMVMSNADYFTLPFANHPVYEDYGLPSYVALPLETALSRCDSFDMFNMVILIYFKFIKLPVTKPMITEDAYRCLESIQDKAFRISDQLRLAVILMVMPFVNNSSDRFENIIKVHEKAKSPDCVAEYVMEKVRKTRGTFGSSGGTMIQWKKALLSAREAMLLRNGSVEDSESVPSLATKSELLRQMGQSEPTRSILKKTPRRAEEDVIDERTAFREAMQRLVAAFEKFELESGNDASGNHLNY